MGSPFTEITIYSSTPHKVGTPEYVKDSSLENFVSDLYVRMMNGYKPPNTSRISINPAFHKIWNRTWRNGSVVLIAPYFNYEEFSLLDKRGKHLYILNLIQAATLELSNEYNWDKTVFENAYDKIIEANFLFKIDYSIKKSRDKKKQATLSIEKLKP